ncbi:MAG: hypothetical protein LUE13_06420 [Akkermansiaceae bacterium]|nr:hypothetical protein [Akkermansiaceae bacterium]
MDGRVHGLTFSLGISVDLPGIMAVPACVACHEIQLVLFFGRSFLGTGEWTVGIFFRGPILVRALLTVRETQDQDNQEPDSGQEQQAAIPSAFSRVVKTAENYGQGRDEQQDSQNPSAVASEYK